MNPLCDNIKDRFYVQTDWWMLHLEHFGMKLSIFP